MRIALLKDSGPLYQRRIVDASSVFEMFRDDVHWLDREAFWVVLVDGRNSVLGVKQVSVGSLTATLVHPREVFKPALLANSAAVVLVHNHPSGNPDPSAEDDALTNRLRQAGELLGIRVLDHVIVTGEQFVSMAERGRW